MPRESIEAKAARLKKIIVALDRIYPEAHCELNHADPLQLLIATILSAQCTDKRVNIVTKELFKKYQFGIGLTRTRRLPNWSRPSSPPVFSATRRRTSRRAAANWLSFTPATSRARWRN